MHKQQCNLDKARMNKWFDFGINSSPSEAHRLITSKHRQRPIPPPCVQNAQQRTLTNNKLTIIKVFKT